MISKRTGNIKSIVSGKGIPTHAYSLKFRRFRPRVRFEIKRKKYVIKTAENHKELSKALSLRYEVFYREYKGKKALIKYDTDKYDKSSDHLIIIDRENGEVTGCYRLISSNYSDNFYSESEFIMDNFKRNGDSLLELGRACVHKDYRNGITIALLWIGIVKYIKMVDARFLFGCSSVKTENLLEIALLYRYMIQNDLVSNEFGIEPIPGFNIGQLYSYLDLMDQFDFDSQHADRIVPPLLKSYIKAGSRIACEPAYDIKFGCADFLTILDTRLINENYSRKFLKPS